MEKSFAEKVADAKAAVDAVSPRAAYQLRGLPGVVFVDPRPAEAIASTTGIIPGAHRVSLDDIASGNFPEALQDRSVHVVASCQGGPMGAIAAHAFEQQGFAQVNYVDGGTQAWLDAGFETRGRA